MNQSSSSSGPIVTLLCPSLKNLTLTPVAMSGSETLGRPFEFVIDVLSPAPQLPPLDLLGAPVTLQMEAAAFQVRNFNGIVASFENRGPFGTGYLARLWVRPWLWLLTRQANCCIWSPCPKGQDPAKCVSVTDILKAVFEQQLPGSKDLLYASAAVDYTKLSGAYQPLDLACQYRETDFNFVSRLMEGAGIYYYFAHTPTGHTLVLLDEIQQAPAPPLSVPYAPNGGQPQALIEHISEWNQSFEVRTGIVSFSDYDFEKPRWTVAESAGALAGYANDRTTVYDYPGNLLQGSLLVGPTPKDFASVRLQQAQFGLVEFSGLTNSRTLAVGQVFQLTGHPLHEYDGSYLVVSANYRITPPDTSSGGDAVSLYMCQFTAIRSDTQYRTPASAVKPSVRGPQTAIVVGHTADDEIYTDQYGRVCVKMHWEKVAAKDQNLLCYVRVSQHREAKHEGDGGPRRSCARPTARPRARPLPSCRERSLADRLGGRGKQGGVRGGVCRHGPRKAGGGLHPLRGDQRAARLRRHALSPPHERGDRVDQHRLGWLHPGRLHRRARRGRVGCVDHLGRRRDQQRDRERAHGESALPALIEAVLGPEAVLVVGLVCAAFPLPYAFAEAKLGQEIGWIIGTPLGFSYPPTTVHGVTVPLGPGKG